MSKIKITEDELNQLINAKTVKNNIVNEFGQISIIELELAERKKRAESLYVKAVENEYNISKSLQDKYGQGTVDISTGTFIPSA